MLDFDVVIYAMLLGSLLSPHFVLFIYVLALLDEKLQWKKLLRYLIMTVIPAFLFYLLIYRGMDLDWKPRYVLISVFNVGICTFAISRLWKRGLWWALAVTGIGGIMQDATDMVLSSGSMQILPIAKHLAEWMGLLQSLYLLCPIAALCMRALLRKLHFGRCMRFLLEDERNLPKIAVRIVLLLASMEYFIVQLNGEGIAYDIAAIIWTVLLLCILMYLSGKEKSEREVRQKETVILQQQLYMENLEEMQRETRAFRHDYKNLLSGMYLYAQEGETEKIQKALEGLEIDFDQKIGERIHLAAQLGNIQIPEIKSLILSKLTEMNAKKIIYNLEILYPVFDVGMDVWDFNRCLGILLDNAIEAAEQSEGRSVELLLMCQAGFLTARVENSWSGKLDVSRIWENGYSTKGKKRGQGLYIYQRILDKYPDAAPMTSWKDNRFVQELTIGVSV